MNDTTGLPANPDWLTRLRRSMMPVFLGLTVALLGLAAVIAQTVVAQQEARRRAMNEGDAIIALQRILVTMVDAESGQRGYLLTKNKAYLEPYAASKQRLDETLARVRAADGETSDETDSAQRVDQIEKLARDKFEEMDRTVQFADAGFDDQAIALVRSDIGKRQMDALRGEIARLGAEKAASRRDAFARATALESRMLPLVGVLGTAILALVVAGFRSERNRAHATAEAEQASALRDANERATLLARELNHRVKNLFSVILSIVTLSARKQAPTAEVIEDIRARIHALSRAHVASQGRPGEATVMLADTIGETLKPYADADGTRVRIAGPAIELPVRMVTPIGLIVHELATNAAKYGALGADGGTVAVSWTVAQKAQDRKELILSWIESGGPALSFDSAGPGGRGFGTRMTALAAGQLGGTIEREWPASGAIARVTFPVS